MKLRLIAVATITAAVAALIRRHLRGVREQSMLQSSAERYQIPRGTAPVTRDTVIGKIKLCAAGGYYSGAAILLFLPRDFNFTPEMIAAFNAATDRQFHIDRTPDADAMITAGLDHHAYRAGRHAGHWKESSAPRLKETADILVKLIADACKLTVKTA